MIKHRKPPAVSWRYLCRCTECSWKSDGIMIGPAGRKRAFARARAHVRGTGHYTCVDECRYHDFYAEEA